MATNFLNGKIGKIGLHFFIRRSVIRNGLDYRNADLKRFICNDLARSYENLVKFGPATPEFKRVVAFLVLFLFYSGNKTD